MVTIDEIRKIAQPSEKMKEEIKSYPFMGRVLRRMSPHFTKFFVEHNISANKITALSILFGMIGGLLFVSGNYFIMMIGCVFCGFWNLFDCVDGEIARVTDTKTYGGMYLEGIHDPIIESCFLACFGIGLYRTLGSIVFVFFGFTFALCICLVDVFNKSRRYAETKIGEKKEKYVFPLMKKKSVTGAIYKSVYRKVRLLFLFPHAYLILAGTLVFEILSPIKLSYTIHGVTLNILSTYFFLYGFDWMARTIISSISNYTYLMKRMV